MIASSEYQSDILPEELVYAYMTRLVGQFFKILPLFESGEPSITEHMRSLQVEMIGCRDLICALNHDACYLSLVSILQYFISNADSLGNDLHTVKREVFKAISLCNALREKYGVQVKAEEEHIAAQ